MYKTFLKFEILNKYAWLSLLVIMITMVLGFFSKINEIITQLKLKDTSKLRILLEKNEILSTIADKIGSGFKIIAIFYIALIIVYIIVSFVLPTITYYILRLFIKEQSNICKNIIVYVLMLTSFLPGIWIILKYYIIFSTLSSIHIIFKHQIVIVLTQIIWILSYIVTITTYKLKRKGEK